MSVTTENIDHDKEYDKEHDKDAFNDADDTLDEIDVQTESLESEADAREKALAARALKRAERAAVRHDSAEKLKESGDVLFNGRNYIGAAAHYLDAIKLWSSNPAYHTILSCTYLKLEGYQEAEHAATKALTLDPKSLEARYYRGLARMELRMLKGAKIDFETVLSLDNTYTKAQNSLNILLLLLEASSKLGVHEISEDPLSKIVQKVDYSYPHIDDDKLEIASMSDSGDCNHVGNGITCRFYNHDGCARGVSCAFSHAPDEKSVRDDLGKNVCIYHLLGACKFGDLKCIYSHSKKCLPKRGWWTSEDQIAKVKTVLEHAEQQAREQRALDHLLYKLESRSAKRGGRGRANTNGRKGTGKTANNKDKPPTKHVKTLSKSSASSRRSPVYHHQGGQSSDTSAEFDERMANGGFTDYEVNELLSQGVKPWDDDAWDVLHALSY